MSNSFFKTYREKHGLSRKELALRLGVTEGAIGHIERGFRSVTAKRAVEWAEVLKVKPADIMFPEQPKQSKAKAAA
jgi:transcriptional regulator with XRE-family HTH domain